MYEKLPKNRTLRTILIKTFEKEVGNEHESELIDKHCYLNKTRFGKTLYVKRWSKNLYQDKYISRQTISSNLTGSALSY